MKRLWIAFAILLTLMIATLSNIWYLSYFISDMTQTLEQAQSLAETDQTEQAAQLTQQCQQRFDNHSFYLHVTLTHQGIDAIEAAFDEVAEYLRLQETGSHYAAANAKLIAQLELTLESEQLTLKNIL